MSKRRRVFWVCVLVTLFAVGFCGCAAPQVISPRALSRSALEQELISKALRRSLGEAPNKRLLFSILEGMRVAVEVSCISQSTMSGGISEDARFVESVVTQKLLEQKVLVVKSGSEDAILRVVVDTLGTDLNLRSFPHTYLPFYYSISYKATASVSLYAYDAKGKQAGLLLSYQGRGEEVVKEWSLLGIFPFK